VVSVFLLSSTALLRACVRKGERSNKQAFLMQAQPSAKSSFCLGTDRTAISQSLLNPFLLAAFFFKPCCAQPAEQRQRRELSLSIYLSVYFVCTYFEDTFLPRILLKLTKTAFLATSGVSSSKTYSIYNPVGMSPCRQPSKRVFVCVYLQVFFVLC